jgi:hypothetical protein
VVLVVALLLSLPLLLTARLQPLSYFLVNVQLIFNNEYKILINFISIFLRLLHVYYTAFSSLFINSKSTSNRTEQVEK